MHLSALLPQPRAATFTGGALSMTGTVTVGRVGEVDTEADYLTECLAAYARPSAAAAPPVQIALVADPEADDLGDEGYRLNVTAGGICLVGARPAGVFYGIQTLLQLITVGDDGAVSIPCCSIEDSPRFGWRGLMLDVSRHFMPVTFIKKLIDLMAMHKFNSLHLHLTDDQGWRVQIDAYPELASKASVRAETIVGHQNARPEGSGVFDGTAHGGCYSKADVRDIVAYAASRHITVVPEIEMPGHAEAVFACYPELSCTGGPFTVSNHWGIHHEAYCAGNDDVFTFLTTVLDEVIELFPSEFIHIGGDECLKDRWKACPKCQERIRTEGLADEHELQSWFVRRIEKFVASRGRRLIGWDEILEGGLPAGATVMSWRGEEGGVAAAKAGHDVVMTPHGATYFDYYQGDREKEPLAIGGSLNLKQVYNYSPIPDALTGTERDHVLGTQGQLWTEYMATPDHVEYMAFPRACALAEVAWGTSNPADWPSFEARLKRHLLRLDAMNVNYHPLD
ncbi:MAG TPA: beta-N-acetylhexosaminidase [Capsulimonadaceae bacterium]|jgi:hexosaminidase